MANKAQKTKIPAPLEILQRASVALYRSQFLKKSFLGNKADKNKQTDNSLN